MTQPWSCRFTRLFPLQIVSPCRARTEWLSGPRHPAQGLESRLLRADQNGCSPSVFTAPRQSLWSPLMMSLVRSPLPGVGWGVLKVLLSILISPWLSSQGSDYPLGRRLRGGPRSEGILGTGCRQGVALKVRKALPGIQGPALPWKTPCAPNRRPTASHCSVQPHPSSLGFCCPSHLDCISLFLFALPVLPGPSSQTHRGPCLPVCTKPLP